MANALTGNGVFGRLLSDPAVADAFSADRVTAHMLAYEAAWTGGLRLTGQVSTGEAEAAIAAIAAHRPDLAAIGAGTERDGVPVPALVSGLRSGLPPHGARAIHGGATSQDVLDTALVLALRQVSNLLEDRLNRVLAGVADLDRRFGAVEMTGRTRMQAALPIPVSHRVESWRAGLQARQKALPILRARVEKVQLGGPTGLRDAHLQAMARHMAEALALAGAPVWHSDRASILDYGAWLAGVAGALGKMGGDIALMAQQGIDEVAIGGAGGSSSMPHKHNPVLAEILVALGRFVTGQLGLLGQCLLHEQERSGSAWALEWMVLPDMCEATGTALRHADTLLGRIERLGPAG